MRELQEYYKERLTIVFNEKFDLKISVPEWRETEYIFQFDSCNHTHKNHNIGSLILKESSHRSITCVITRQDH